MIEARRIEIVKAGSHGTMSTDEARALLAELDAACEPLEPLGAHPDHIFDERCPVCVPPEC